MMIHDEDGLDRTLAHSLRQPSLPRCQAGRRFSALHGIELGIEMQVYDEDGVDRTPKQLVQRQMVSVRPPPHAALSSMLSGGVRNTGGSILGRQHHRESRMSSRMSKLSMASLLHPYMLGIISWACARN